MTLNRQKAFRMGETSEEVRELQRLLLASGFDIGPGGDDGFLGQHTDAAIRYFQSINRMPEVNGAVDATFIDFLETYHTKLNQAKEQGTAQGISSWMITAFLVSITNVRDKDWPEFVNLWSQQLEAKHASSSDSLRGLIECLQAITVPGRLDILDCLLTHEVQWQEVVDSFLVARNALGQGAGTQS